MQDWLRFNAEDPPRLIARNAAGSVSKLTDSRGAFAERPDDKPMPAVDGAVCWRLIDLVQWLWQELRVCLSDYTVSPELLKLEDRCRELAEHDASPTAAIIDSQSVKSAE